MDLEASLKIFTAMGGAEAGAIAQRFWTVGADADFADYMRVCMPLYNRTKRPDDGNARQRIIFRPELWRHFFLNDGEVRRMDLRASLGRVPCPVLVLGGEVDPITPPRVVREIASSLPAGRGELHLFSECGHGPFRDDPARVFPIIRSFVQRNA